MIPNHLLRSLLFFVTPGECTTVMNPQKEVHWTLQPRFGRLATTKACGLQNPNRTVTPVGTTLSCKVWSFTEGNTPGHHIREYNQVFPRQLMKYEETHQRR
jgi:hypothetical protein